MRIANIALIGMIIAVLGVVIAYFSKHKRIGGALLALGIVSAGMSGYESVKDQKLTELATSEYDAVLLYKALYEATGNEKYKEIAQDEETHLKILSGYGYQASGEKAKYDLNIQGAIASERDAIDAYESVVSYVVADATLEADLNRILQDEKEHLDELIEMSISEDTGDRQGFLEDLNIRDLNIRDLNIRDRLGDLGGLLDRIRGVIT